MTRKLFTTFAIAAIAASMLVGCKPSTDDTPTPAPEATVKSDQAPKAPATTPEATGDTKTSATPDTPAKPK